MEGGVGDGGQPKWANSDTDNGLTGIKILFWWGHSSLFPSSLFLLSAQKVYRQTASIMVGASSPSSVSELLSLPRV